MKGDLKKKFRLEYNLNTNLSRAAVLLITGKPVPDSLKKAITSQINRSSARHRYLEALGGVNIFEQIAAES